MTFDIGSVSLAEVMSAVALIGTVVAFLRKPGDQAAAGVTALREEVEKKANSTDVDDVSDKVDQLEERVAVVESELRHMPDRETVHAMELSLRDLQGEMKVLVERIKPIAATSQRLEAWLTDKGK